LRVSVLSIGAWVTQGSQVASLFRKPKWKIDEETAFQTMKTAYDMGCNFFDNAEVYAGGKAEEVMGNCIKRLGVDRSEFIVSTKVHGIYL
jgi:aryl-alcohol dehydrogenase-like predicted oxidoreductase